MQFGLHQNVESGVKITQSFIYNANQTHFLHLETKPFRSIYM